MPVLHPWLGFASIMQLLVVLFGCFGFVFLFLFKPGQHVSQPLLSQPLLKWEMQPERWDDMMVGLLTAGCPKTLRRVGELLQGKRGVWPQDLVICKVAFHPGQLQDVLTKPPRKPASSKKQRCRTEDQIPTAPPQHPFLHQLKQESIGQPGWRKMMEWTLVKMEKKKMQGEVRNLTKHRTEMHQADSALVNRNILCTLCQRKRSPNLHTCCTCSWLLTHRGTCISYSLF